MSFINEALKKAQKEKDTNYIEYDTALSARGKGRTISRIGILWYSLLIIVIIALGVFIYTLMSSRKEPETLITEKKQPPIRAVKKIPVPAPKPDDDIDAKTIYSRAKKHHKQGNLQEAKKLYNESLKLDPGYLDSLNNLGIILINEKDYENGRRYLEKAIRLKPEHPDPYYNLACLFAITGITGQSLEYLKKAVSLDSAVIEWAKKDTDLESLRGIDEFENLIN
jgi:tetratricopeptide (TPR) repeat protein